MRIKTLLSILLSFCMLTIPYHVYADSNQGKTVKLSIEDAYNQAISANSQFKKIDKSIFTLIKPYGANKELHNRSRFDMQTECNKLYTRLRSGEFLQSYEQGELVMYYAVFKDSEFFKDKSLSPVINPEEFPNCDIWVKMMQMKFDNETLRVSVIDGVRQLYDSLMDTTDSITTSDEYLNILEKEVEDANKEYNAGSISELEKITVQNDYEIKKLELNKLKRTKENLERTLKKTLGVDFETDIEIIPYKLSEKDLKVPDYESCINSALINRQEIAIPEMNLLSAQIQIPILDNYLWYMPENEGLQMTKQETLLSIDELKNDIKVQKEYVKQDINKAFSQVTYMKKNLEIEEKKFSNIQKSYDKAKVQYKSGQISIISYNKSKINYDMGKVSYEKAMRNLAYHISKLNSACGV